MNMKHAVKAALRPAYHLAKRVLSEPSTSSIPAAKKDLFLSWLRYINPGMLTGGNIDLLEYCIERLPSAAPLVEIGSFAGLSLNHIIRFLQHTKRSNPVFSVDHWWFEGARDGTLEGTSISSDAYRKHVIDTFRSNICLFSGDHLPHHLELSSDVFFDAWDKKERRTDFFGHSITLGGPIAMAYIDGEHSYKQSMRDALNVDRYLEVGGFIIFDDSGDNTDWESNRTARELATLPRYEIIAKNPNYCVRKIS
jgi:Methyltransferase domain